MNKIIENRVAQLVKIGFLKEEKELHALMVILNLIEKSDKFQGIGDKRMVDERVQKEQISFINNMQEMFSNGSGFLSFYNYHYNKGRNARALWNIVSLVEKRDVSSFNKVFSRNGRSFKKKGVQKQKRKTRSSDKKTGSVSKPKIISKKSRKFEGSE